MKISSKICSAVISAAVLLSSVSFTAFSEYGELEKDEDAGFSYQKVDNDDDGKYDYIYIVEYYNQVADVVIPDEIDGVPVTHIGYGSFARSSNLTSVTMGKNIKVIADKAFMNCEALKTIKFSDNIEEVGRMAFTNSLWLDNFRTEKKPLIISNMLVDGVGCEGEVDIPETVTKILPYAFDGAVNVTKVAMPDSITWAGESSFNGCDKLESIRLSDNLTSIEEGTFNGCTALKEIDLPESVRSIGILAFSDCQSLATVRIYSPDCDITSSPYIFVGGYNADLDPIFAGTIYGYADSTAQTFAEEMNYIFKLLDGTPQIPTTTAVTTAGTTTSTTSVTTKQEHTEECLIPDYLYGDVDLDDRVDIADVAKLSKYLLNKSSYPLGNGDEKSEKKAMIQADVTHDDIIDTRDISRIIEYNLVKLTIDDLQLTPSAGQPE